MMSEALIRHCREVHRLVVGPGAGRMRIEIGSAADAVIAMEVHGTDAETAKPRAILLTAEEVRLAFLDPAMTRKKSTA